MTKAAIEDLLGAKVIKVNTLNIFKKYALKPFLKFAREGEAVEVATRAWLFYKFIYNFKINILFIIKIFNKKC